MWPLETYRVDAWVTIILYVQNAISEFVWKYSLKRAYFVLRLHICSHLLQFCAPILWCWYDLIIILVTFPTSMLELYVPLPLLAPCLAPWTQTKNWCWIFRSIGCSSMLGSIDRFRVHAVTSTFASLPSDLQIRCMRVVVLCFQPCVLPW